MAVKTTHLRVRLVSLDAELLALVASDSVAFFKRVNATPAAGWVELAGVLAWANEKLLSDSGLTGWWAHLVVDTSLSKIVGMASFKGPPGVDGWVEIAYFTAPGHEGKGVATAAAGELVRVALRDSRVRTIRAHTLMERNASVRVLEKNGFQFVGQVKEPEDGQVWRWEKSR